MQQLWPQSKMLIPDVRHWLASGSEGKKHFLFRLMPIALYTAALIVIKLQCTLGALALAHFYAVCLSFWVFQKWAGVQTILLFIGTSKMIVMFVMQSNCQRDWRKSLWWCSNTADAQRRQFDVNGPSSTLFSLRPPLLLSSAVLDSTPSSLSSDCVLFCSWWPWSGLSTAKVVLFQ